MTDLNPSGDADGHTALLEDALSIFRSAVDRVRASTLFRELDVSEVAPRRFDTYAGVRVVAFGKAAMAMAGAAETVCEDHDVSVLGGVAVVPPGYPDSLPASERAPEIVEVITGNHPVAAEDSAEAGQRVLEEVSGASADELVLVLVSGGGTALVSTPVEEVDAWDLRATYRLLLRCGATIHDVNAVRKHLTRVGGGQLAASCRADIASLVVSDVPGDPLSVIASGPTVPDPSTFEDALRVAYQHGIWHELPESVRNHLAAGARGRRKETPNSEDELGAVKTEIIGRNADAIEAATEEAKQLGYELVRAEGAMSGEARDVGRTVAGNILSAPDGGRRAWLWGGETTVTVSGNGTGGRNQELALSAALEMEEQAEKVLVLSGGTDGIDGPTDAAGAWATPKTTRVMRESGVDPDAALENNDSYAAHGASGTRVTTGPTHTNVMDVVIGLRA